MEAVSTSETLVTFYETVIKLSWAINSVSVVLKTNVSETSSFSIIRVDVDRDDEDNFIAFIRRELFKSYTLRDYMEQYPKKVIFKGFLILCGNSTPCSHNQFRSEISPRDL
jgi:hypothetical protein